MTILLHLDQCISSGDKVESAYEWSYDYFDNGGWRRVGAEPTNRGPEHHHHAIMPTFTTNKLSTTNSSVGNHGPV
ncbi:hypothetical protein SCA6_016516 [Theobroma cacao]